MVRVEIVLGDISHEQVDAIVSSASPDLSGAEGVEASVRRRGGVAVLDECREKRKIEYPRGMRPGDVTATSAGKLEARWVLHAVGPDFVQPATQLELARCFRELLRVAEQLQISTLSVPAISTGRRGYPIDLAAQLALRTVRFAAVQLDCVRFVLRDKQSYAAFVRAFVSTV